MTSYRYLSQKIGLSFLVIYVLLCIMPLLASANQPSINYVSLGDSLAAGQTPYSSFDKGYPHFLAEHFKDAGYGVSFEDRYAVSGYTTVNILDDIRNDVRMDRDQDVDMKGIRQNIKDADLITLNAGANDLKKLLVGGQVPELSAVFQVMNQVSGNISEMMKEIQSLNPRAKIYFLGYYNPLPYLPQEQKSSYDMLLNLLNKNLKGVCDQLGAVFVPVNTIISGNYQVYLPNPQDQHLSLEGYQRISEEFWKLIEPGYPALYKEWPTSPFASTDKDWTIAFNTSLDANTISDDTIYVKDSKHRLVHVDVSLVQDGKTIKILPPVQGYDKDETYHLFIQGGILSSTGKPLKEAIRFTFTTTGN